MISNERQLSIAKRKLRELDKAIHNTSSDTAQESLRRLQAQMNHEVQMYLATKKGLISEFRLSCIDDLATALIRARIAKGWTQKDLADRIGVSEQMVQRDEAGGYENASLTRLADVADALDYTVTGVLHPATTRPPVIHSSSSGGVVENVRAEQASVVLEELSANYVYDMTMTESEVYCQ